MKPIHRKPDPTVAPMYSSYALTLTGGVCFFAGMTFVILALTYLS